ncbi:MAG: presqualene diphosphate synthase HpnD [Burkholderiaceae bacterium]
MTPEAYCQDKAAKSGSSFYYAFLFLPPQRRAAITALYAFCREVDDVVDETSDSSLAARTLAWWSEEVGRLYQGEPTHPVTRALAPHLEAFSITRPRLLEIIAGMEMDLHQSRYLDFVGLAHYCHHVAGVVGQLSANIFGASDPRTANYAEKLGLAVQLTNIIRDVGEDARKGRIYLPIDELKRFGVPAGDLLMGKRSAGFSELMRFQAARARSIYAEALALLPDADRRAQRPALIMAAIYRALLDEVEAERFEVLNQRIALTPIRKLWIAWRTWVGTR